MFTENIAKLIVSEMEEYIQNTFSQAKKKFGLSTLFLMLSKTESHLSGGTQVFVHLMFIISIFLPEIVSNIFSSLQNILKSIGNIKISSLLSRPNIYGIWPKNISDTFTSTCLPLLRYDGKAAVTSISEAEIQVFPQIFSVNLTLDDSGHILPTHTLSDFYLCN